MGNWICKHCGQLTPEKYDECIDCEKSRFDDISCPFCSEVEFDKIGLKSHLINGDCDVFNETENLN